MPSFAQREMERFDKKEAVLAEAAKCLEVLTQGSFVKEVKRLGYSPYSQELLEVLRAINDLESQYPSKKTNRHLGAMSEQISKSDILNSVSVDAYVVLRRYASAEVIQQLGLAVRAHETVQKYSMVQKKVGPFLDAERAFLNILENSSPALVASLITSGIESTTSTLMTLYTESPWGSLTSLRTDNKGKDRSQEVVAEVRHQAHELLTEVPSPEVLGRVLSDVELFLVDNIDNLAKFIEENKLSHVGQLLNALKVAKIDSSFFVEALKTYCLKNKIALDKTGSLVALMTALKQRAAQEQATLAKQAKQDEVLAQEQAYYDWLHRAPSQPISTDSMHRNNEVGKATATDIFDQHDYLRLAGEPKTEIYFDSGSRRMLRLTMRAPFNANVFDVVVNYRLQGKNGDWETTKSKLRQHSVKTEGGQLVIEASLPYDPKKKAVTTIVTMEVKGQPSLSRTESVLLGRKDPLIHPSEEAFSYFRQAKIKNLQKRAEVKHADLNNQNKVFSDYLVATLALPNVTGPFKLTGQLYRESGDSRLLSANFKVDKKMVKRDSLIEIPIYPPLGDDIGKFVAVFTFQEGSRTHTLEIPGYELAKALE